MAFQQIKKEFGFKQSDGYMHIVTDFETIKIYCNNPEKYAITEKNLIRFISEELLEEYPCVEEIHGVCFLPSHKTNDFLRSLDKEEVLPELKSYYSDEMKFDFKEGTVLIKTDSSISHSDRSKVGTSFFGADAASVDNLIDAGKQLLKLNAMKGYKIATGEISGGIGLLERSSKDKSTTPKSRHYNFWKFDHELTNFNFFDVARQFSIYSEEEVFSK